MVVISASVVVVTTSVVVVSSVVVVASTTVSAVESELSVQDAIAKVMQSNANDLGRVLSFIMQHNRGRLWKIRALSHSIFAKRQLLDFLKTRSRKGAQKYCINFPVNRNLEGVLIHDVFTELGIETFENVTTEWIEGDVVLGD